MSLHRQSIALALVLLLPGSSGADAAADRGAQIAQQGTAKGVAPCMACHGADGGGMAAAAYPRLAGLDADYLVKQLRDFRGGTRKNPVMTPMAANLTEDEVSAVAAYYAAMPVPQAAAQPPPADAAKVAADLVRWGDWSGRAVPGCSQCHAPDGNGIGSYFPPLAGQHASYIKAQLLAWQAGTRVNDPLGLMKAVADRLTGTEIDALAAYYAAQPTAQPGHAETLQSPVPAGVAARVDAVHTGDIADHGAPPAGRVAEAGQYFASPPRDQLPDGPFGDAVREGQAIFQSTNTHPASSRYVGNSQACGNCHIDAGRLAKSAPLWAAWVAYPAYRSKTKKVDTYIERIQGCFRYSMNAQASPAGGPPAADSDTIVSLVAYSFWLAKGAPTGDATMPGRGYPRLADTADGFDPERGATVYAAKCALCHGADGAGVTDSDGRTLFPPLWGGRSYNWGAGMHRIDTAAAFVKHNMPLGLGDSLSDQEAWDVAAFMNSHERPQDPRHTGDLAATAAQFHASKYDYYYNRKSPDGYLLGERPATK